MLFKSVFLLVYPYNIWNTQYNGMVVLAHVRDSIVCCIRANNTNSKHFCYCNGSTNKPKTFFGKNEGTEDEIFKALESILNWVKTGEKPEQDQR